MGSDMNSRRRIATYGRVSRKTNYDFKYSTQYSAAEQPLLTILAKNQDPIQEDGHIPAKNNSIEFEESGSNFKATRCTRSTSRPSHTVELESKQSASGKQLPFHKLSFKCEGSSKYAPDGKLSEQKRGLECNSEANQASVVYDDQSMSQVSAFGAISHHKTICKKNKRPSSEKLHNTEQDQRLSGPSAIGHYGEPRTEGSEPAKIVSSDLRARQRLTAAERSQKQKVTDLGTRSHQMRSPTGDCSSTEIGNTNTFQANSKASPPSHLYLISPKPSAADVENSKDISLPQGPAQLPKVTTTHQRELWDMLLKGDAGRQGPITFEPPNVMIALRDDISKSHSGSEREHNLQGSSYNQVRKRRRLVDYLSPCNIDKYKNDTALIDQDTGFKGSGGNTISDMSSAAANSSSCEPYPLITPSHDHVHNSTSLRKPSMPLQGGRLKVTYARQRSFVGDDDSNTMADVVISADPPQHSTIWESAESDMQVKSEESSEEIINSQGSMTRSIYELRKAGSNARAVCNMEDIFDDIRGETGLSLEHKVSRVLELIDKLQDVAYCRLFIEQGLDLRLLSCLDLDNGMVLKALVAAVILHLLVPSTCPSKLHKTRDPRLSNFLLELLDQEGNLKILVKKIGFVKPGNEQANFEKSWESLLKSAAWGRLRPMVVTGRVIGLRCLEYLARHTYGSSQAAADIAPHCFWKIARILDPNFSISVQNPNPRSQLDLQLALSILEIYTIGKGSMIEESIWKGETIGYLKSFLPRLSTWREEDIGKLRTSALRLYLNLMNNRPKVCEVFATTEIVDALLVIIVSHFRRLAQDNCDDAALLLDNLILALGSMINLAEWCNTAPQLVMNLRHEDSSFLDILLMLYTSKQVEALEVSRMLSDLTQNVDFDR